MYQLTRLDDTIAAISSPAGQGGIGIVRLSGKDVLSICDRLFVAKNKKSPSTFRSFTVRYGWVVRDLGEDNQSTIDEALLTVMRAPKSYTKEDVIEISCHGGKTSLEAILKIVLEKGARLAEPGEFTKRAFLNGRLDLAQAEAVLDIIQAKTEVFLKLSQTQLRGELSVELEEIREQLLKIYTEIEAILNFPEDDLEASGRRTLQEKIETAKARIEKLLKSSQHGKILREGAKVILCGKPNVGKSSLLNALLKVPRAIVTDIAGTTRDTIEENAQIKGIPLQLIDTAGLLNPRNRVEEEAVKRSRQSMAAADLILLVIDGSEPLSSEDHALLQELKDQNAAVILNKSDLKERFSVGEIEKSAGFKKVMRVSALEKTAIEELENMIAEIILQGQPLDAHGMMVSNTRHIQSLKECREALMKAQEGCGQGLSLEFISEDIKTGINCLDAITGRNIDQDLLDKIFSEFCIGK